MARLTTKGSGGTLLMLDGDGKAMPVVRFGTVHNLTNPTEATQQRNGSAFSANTGLVLIQTTGYGHFKKGTSSVAATAADALVAPGQWWPVPIFTDATGANDYISIISAAGAGAIIARLVEIGG